MFHEKSMDIYSDLMLPIITAELLAFYQATAWHSTLPFLYTFTLLISSLFYRFVENWYLRIFTKLNPKILSRISFRVF